MPPSREASERGLRFREREGTSLCSWVKARERTRTNRDCRLWAAPDNC